MPQQLEITDFSGGITDYVMNAPQNKLKTCDNLLIVQFPEFGKPYSRPGSGLYDSANPQIPAGAQRISTLNLYKDILHIQSSQKLYYPTTSYQTVNGPTGNNAFPGASTSTYFTYANWNWHTLWAHSGQSYVQKSYVNNSGGLSLIEAGLPKVDSSGINFSYGAGADNYLYCFVYAYTYQTKDSVTFLMRGQPSDIRETDSVVLPIDISTIPVLSNGGTHNFDTSNIKVEIYRTATDQTTFYKVGEVTNGTTTFHDNVADADLTANEVLYTTGGAAPRSQPPKAKLVHVLLDTAYYANIIDSANETLNFRIVQSIPGIIDGVPETFFVDIDDEITGLSSTKSNIVVLTRKGNTYRIDGLYDELGRNGMVAQRISDIATCISGQSVVQALDGLFWAGFEGIYYSDGYQVLKLNGDYDKTWKLFVTDGGVSSAVKQGRIQGKYDKRKNRIWWTVQKNSATDVDLCYVLDLNWGVRQNATFTTCSGLDSWAPSAIEFDNGDLVRADRRGYLLKHNEALFSDIRIDEATSPANWVQQTIFYDLESVAFNFGSSFLRKYVTGINLVADSVTNLSLQIISSNDNDKSIANLLPIRYRGNLIWGDPDVYWGDPLYTWGKDGLLTEKRRMSAAGGLRCTYKSIRFTNAYVAIINSDILGNISINASLKKATLLGSFFWPSNAVDWYISFANDNFTRDYLITGRTDTELTYSDALNASESAASSQWQIRGYPKDEVFNLIDYCVLYENFSYSQTDFKASEDGEIS